ncbi:hypothetical protein [Amycolatopsis sp. EV170708-02-1]|nr:hypothetical protein [Amycolatopsis sp. EV170708-02-1]UMO99969.1 hypothetical protein MJQ72_26045 [Amycolatopsis sp. EV170708-02-1]
MTKVPVLWSIAYNPKNNILTRLAARATLRALTFLRALAQADHDTFVVL